MLNAQTLVGPFGVKLLIFAVFLLVAAACNGQTAPPLDIDAPDAPPVSDVAADADAYQAQRENCTWETPCWPEVVDTMPQSFNEAPELAARVEAGELPPIEERLPDEPLVINPAESIGQYGGAWDRAFTGPGDRQNLERLVYNNLIRWDTGVSELRPYIFRDWESNEDGSQWVFHLRPGMKWSDGAPFTTEDFMFWYEHMLQNDQVVTAIPSYMIWGGELALFEALDEYTLQVSFAAPFPLFAVRVAGAFDVGSQFTHGDNGLGMIAPKHYLEQFHPAFAGEEEADSLADAAGYDNWGTHLISRNNPHMNPDVPVTSAWKPVTTIASDQYILERNPYYFVVDSEGNQLPYLDQIRMEAVEELEVLNLRAIAGNYTVQGRHIDFAKLPVIRENAQQGDYFVDFWTSPTRHPITVYFNMDYAGDPELLELMRNVEFRRALSLALEREEFNEIYFLGVGRPASFCPAGASPYFTSDRWDEGWGRFAPDEANEILDEIGLTERDSEGYRLMPNGERITLVMDTISGAFLDYPAIGEMVEQQWAEVGIYVNLNPVERSFWVERMNANQHMLSLFEVISWHPETESVFIRGQREFGLGSSWASQETRDPDEYDGPEWYKRIAELHWQARTEPDPDIRHQIYMEATELFCDNTPNLGIVVDVPVWTTLIKNYVRNVPKPLEWVVFAQTPANGYPETWYILQD